GKIIQVLASGTPPQPERLELGFNEILQHDNLLGAEPITSPKRLSESQIICGVDRAGHRAYLPQNPKIPGDNRPCSAYSFTPHIHVGGKKRDKAVVAARIAMHA